MNASAPDRRRAMQGLIGLAAALAAPWAPVQTWPNRPLLRRKLQ